ncbi:MAG: replicative DNA helicase [Chitinophagales bacterium]|nr:replicative DNA helicase [Chitinophagales bacterium]
MAESSDYIGRANKLLRNKAPNKSSDLGSYTFGKLPPQAKDLEEAVLGAIMIERDALDVAVEILKPESFYIETHQKIYRSIIQLFQKNEAVDILTVTEQLKKNGELDDVGGPFFVTDLTNRVASGANVEYHARIVEQKFIQRELISISSKIIKDAYEDTTDVFDLLDEAEKNLFSIAETHIKKNGEEINVLVTKAIKEIGERMDQEGKLIGVPSGFIELDRVTGGWQKSDLIIIAARPGMGKTAFTLALARNASIDHKKPIAVFSLEMSSNQLVQRLLSMEAELASEKLRKGNLERYEFQQLTSKVENLKDSNLFIDDTPAINIFELRAKCRRLKSKYDIQMVVIDYLQLMSGGSEGKGGGNREQEISQISRSLKSIAKELDIPVIALSQLNRSVETRGGAKRPMLSDLRESGAIEQDADLVIFLYRPEYYGFTEDEENNDVRGIAEVIIAKHRNGALRTVKARFVDKFAKFVNLESEYAPVGESDAFSDPKAGIITRGSRLNEMEDFNLPGDNDPDDTPF